EHHTIVDVMKRHFGQEAKVWLFGSRTDDSARGGDIDLMVETPLQDADDVVDAKLNALVELHQRLGDQKIDLVGAPAAPGYRSIGWRRKAGCNCDHRCATSFPTSTPTTRRSRPAC
ncbi:nucleotidyltransferase domain-containing protein, partial [Halomonas campaniensis]|uniref:nucleotidyltransferase domain-containing protein n=1 Tax=Halomonas campaniensis TaxID=213554 RepID=UPI0035622BB8